MVKFFTFCVDINRHPKKALNRTLLLLIKSLEAHLPTFQLIVYTNYEIPHMPAENIFIRPYYDQSLKKLYSGKDRDSPWLNLSFNKIYIYKDLHDEFKEDYTWIDLDTIVVGDISYIDTVSDLFLEHGGQGFKKQWYPFRNNRNFFLPQARQIQGNLWKLNIGLYHRLMDWHKIIQKKKLVLSFDTQDLFNTYIYIRTNGTPPPNIHILGLNYRTNTLNGLGIWSRPGSSSSKHPSRYSLAQLYRDTHGRMRSKLHPTKKIDILSFTFITLRQTWNTREFRNLLI